MEPICPICGSAGRILYRDVEDRINHVPGKWCYTKCVSRQCGHVWLCDRPADVSEFYVDYYTHAADKSGEANPSKRSLKYRACCKALALFGYHRARLDLYGMYLGDGHGRRVLEIGCGNGGRLAFLKERGWDVEGQEIDAVAAALARKITPTVYVGEIDNCVTRKDYDAVVINHVVEHMADLSQALAYVAKLLKPRGRLVVVTPNNESLLHGIFRSNWRGLETPRHLNIFNMASLPAVVSRSGLEIDEVFTTHLNNEIIFSASWALLRFHHPDLGHIAAGRSVLAVASQILAGLVHWLRPGSGEECVVIAHRADGR